MVVAFFILARRIFGRHPRPIALGIKRGHVNLGFPIDHHLRQIIARATGCGDPERKSLCQPHIAQARRGADQGVAVGRVADWAVVIILQPHRFRRWQAVDHRHVFRFDPLKVQREQVGAEGLWHVIQEPCGGVHFIRAQNPTAALFADIPLGVGIAQNGVLGVVLAVFHQHRIGFGDDILVFDRNRRDLDAQQFRRALRVVARGSHNMFGVDFEPIVRPHQPPAHFVHPRARHDPFRPRPAIAVDLNFALNRSAQLPCAFGHGLGHIGGVNVAVLRVIQRAHQIIGAHQGPAVLDLFGRQKFVIDPRCLRDRRIQHIFVHPLGPLRHAQVAHDVKAGVQARLCL